MCRRKAKPSLHCFMKSVTLRRNCDLSGIKSFNDTLSGESQGNPASLLKSSKCCSHQTLQIWNGINYQFHCELSAAEFLRRE